MLADDPLKILIVEQSHDEANRIISILRSADYRIEAQLAVDQGQLQQYLSKRNWDMLIAPTGAEVLPTQQIFQYIRRAERDFPVILISDIYDPAILIEGLRLGAEDVVVKDQDQHLLKVVARSLASVGQRRLCREWERKLALAEKRSEYLMNTSRFPIAVVQEGTYVYANQACASIFGFEEPEEMLCLPVIDNIAACNREKLKAYMVPLQAKQEIMPFEAVVKILNAQGEEHSAFLEINQIQYSGEPSLQFTINSDKLFAANTDQTEEATATAFSAIQPQLVYEMVSRAISKSVQTGKDSVLLNIQIDRFENLKEDLGIAKAEKIVHSMVTFVGSLFNQNFDFARLSENCLVAVLAETSEKQGVKLPRI